MRLLNVQTRQLEEFFDDSIPAYAILSHTWGEEEVTFQDLYDPNHVHKKGYYKIEGTCNLARAAGYSYVWIDTCCIDKSSSAELSEAINSMYRWYHQSAICYAYLVDVAPTDWRDDWSHNPLEAKIRRSRWFTRGWTLQELLAPAQIVFYGTYWEVLGSRVTLQKVISEITSIPDSCLTGYHPWSNLSLRYNVAQRMSWASRRETSRLEDAAYCLIGLFGVNMPLLYGKGTFAFIRLQQAILTRFADESILAWDLHLPDTALVENYDRYARSPHPCEPIGVFAASPAGFAPWSTLQGLDFSCHSRQSWHTESTTEVTNRGLRMTLPLVQYSSDVVLAVLNSSLDGGIDKMLMLPLVRIGKGWEFAPFQRSAKLPAVVGSWDLLQAASLQTIFIQVHVRDFDPLRTNLMRRPQLKPGAIVVRTTSLQDEALVHVSTWNWDRYQVIHIGSQPYCHLSFEALTPNGNSFELVLNQKQTRSMSDHLIPFTCHLVSDSQDDGWILGTDKLYINKTTYEVSAQSQMFLGFQAYVINVTRAKK